MRLNVSSIEWLNACLLKQVDGETLIGLYCNHFDAKDEYVLSYVGILVIIIYKSNQPNGSHTNDFHSHLDLH